MQYEVQQSFTYPIFYNYNFHTYLSSALSWSSALEKVATDWSDQCYFEHSSGCAARLTKAINEGYEAEWNVNQNRDGCGENLYISGAPPAMNAMYGSKNYGILGGIERGWSTDESLLYTYSDSYNYEAGHYTQVIWANTRYVGCGFRQCNGISTKSSSYAWGKLMFTCNYYPPGNWGNQYPYKKGDACSCCDADRKVCTHEGGLCGGGWNKDWNNNYVGNSGKQEVDECYDGLGRNVCQQNGQNNFADATNTPTDDPSLFPSLIPSQTPSSAPTIQHIEPPPSDEESVTVYAVRVSTEVIWLTYTYDFENVQAVIEEIMFEGLAEPYFGLSSVSIDADYVSEQGPFCARPCDYVYGFNTVPMVLQGASMDQKDTIVSSVENGDYAEEFCDKLTKRYLRSQGDGLRCYKVTASVESVTERQYQRFIGDEDDVDEIVFDILNLESYSNAEIFVLILCLCLICFVCWCIGWYAHKRRFKKKLERELNATASYDARVREERLGRQIAATGKDDCVYTLTPTKTR